MFFLGMRTKQTAQRKQKEREADEQHRQELAARASKKRKSQAPSSSTHSAISKLISTKEWSKERRKKLEAKKEFGNNSHLDWNLLKMYGLERDIGRQIA